MRILAIDPGPTLSALVIYETETHELVRHVKAENCHVLRIVQAAADCDRLVVEMIPPYGAGLAVGRDVFDTCIWIGRFKQVWDWSTPKQVEAELLTRTRIKVQLCGTARAKDKNVRQALIDRFGGDEVALGAKKCPMCKGKGWCGRGRPVCARCSGSGWTNPPGPLHGVVIDQWAALGVAVAWAELQEERVGAT